MIVKMLRQGRVSVALAYASRAGAAVCVGGAFPMDLPLSELCTRFREVMDLRPELSNQVLHVPVRLTDMDRRISCVEWGRVAREIIKAHGLDDAPWMAWVHPEGRQGENHLHIIGLNTTFNAKRIDLEGNYYTNQRIASQLEKELALWQAPRVKGVPVLPPEGFVGPSVLPVRGRVDVIREIVQLLITPGMTLPHLRLKLSRKQVELVPKFTIAGTKIIGLGFRFDGTFVKASEVDRQFSLAGLQKLGVSYDPARDLPSLVQPLPPLPMLPSHTATPMGKVGNPKSTPSVKPTKFTYEVPSVPHLTIQLQAQLRVRNLLLDVWGLGRKPILKDTAPHYPSKSRRLPRR